VREGQVVAEAYSRKVGACDATAHAETLAIGAACRALSTRSLADCTFYSVCEPCPMCAGAMINTFIARLVLGARVVALRRSLGERGMPGAYTVEKLIALTGSSMRLTTGVLEADCNALYADLQVGQTSR